MKDQPSPTQDEPWWAMGLTPKPGGNPPDIPPEYLYDPDDEVYWNPLKPWWMRPRTTPPIIDRRVLPSGEVEEWERSRTIPDDFIYDPELDGYISPGEGVHWDIEARMREFEEARRRGDFVVHDTSPEALTLKWTPKKKPAKGRQSSAGKPQAKQQLDLFAGLEDDDDATA